MWWPYWVRVFVSTHIAEETDQDAFAEAVDRWPTSDPPAEPRSSIIRSPATRPSTGCAPEGCAQPQHAQATLLGTDGARSGSVRCVTTAYG